MRFGTVAVCLASTAFAADPGLTIYNQDFAVVRESLALDLKQGLNHVKHDGATAFLEPESVILRDPSGKVVLQILEQNYRADRVSADRLLSLYEGKTIEFLSSPSAVARPKLSHKYTHVPLG